MIRLHDLFSHRSGAQPPPRPAVMDAVAHQERKMVEAALCLEAVDCVSYASMIELVHNGRVRRECQEFLSGSMSAQHWLIEYLKDPAMSRDSVEQRARDYGVDPLNLSVIGIIGTAHRAALKKSQLYKHLNRKKDDPLREFLGKSIPRTMRELRFLREEQAFHAV